MNFVFVLAVGLLAGTISGIVGTGSSIMLVPVLVYEFGPKQAVPIMAVAAVMANLSRILAWWREVDWRACAAYSITGIPAAALGARTLLVLPSHAVDIAIGLFLIAMVPLRHWLAKHRLQISLLHLALGGAVIGLFIVSPAAHMPCFCAECLWRPMFACSRGLRNGTQAVIPGRALRASPESITTMRGYGFRACAQEGASRNHDVAGQ